MDMSPNPDSPSSGGGGNGMGSSSGGASPSVGSMTPQSPSRYEAQKRRDWNTFGQYLRNHRPPLSLAQCSGAHPTLDPPSRSVGCPIAGSGRPGARSGRPITGSGHSIAGSGRPATTAHKGARGWAEEGVMGEREGHHDQGEWEEEAEERGSPRAAACRQRACARRGARVMPGSPRPPWSPHAAACRCRAYAPPGSPRPRGSSGAAACHRGARTTPVK
ncbi:hypothetical protein PR202_ga19687 [Eleusine coracana subsp. coracana]|uniref:ALOG domain-containing protein n=1 Tax=Eleusine coracana subsp. coracana TaxID=191504 RepID=A0AAV5CWS9_ELECO|nr:hypothetical protein PR202_ga19687 [Eleusine coracana subsp. coracana]